MSTTRCWGVDGERERSADGNSFIRRARSDCWTWQCSSVGASFCYLLSKTLFSSFVAKRLGDRLVMWENEVRAVLARMEFGVPRMEFGVPRMESGLAQTGSCEGGRGSGVRACTPALTARVHVVNGRRSSGTRRPSSATCSSFA